MPLIRGEWVPGIAVGIYQRGERDFHGYGVLSEHDSRVPDQRTLYETGSIGKLFTALLLTEADRRHELGMNLPIDRIRGGPEQPEDSPILAWHLASHISGLPREPDDLDHSQQNPYAGYTREKLAAFLTRTRPTEAAGSKYEYSNLAAGLLGVLLENATGLSYSDQIRHRIAGPLELPDTVVDPSTAQLSRLAPPHRYGVVTDTWDADDALAASGCLRSTAADTLRFAELHLHPPGTELGENIRRLTEVRFPFPEGGGMGLGWHILDDGTCWHNGSTGGYHCYTAFNREHDFALAILANDICPEVSVVGQSLVGVLAGQSIEPVQLKELMLLTEEHLDRLAGRYVDFDAQLGIEISRVGRRLLARLDDQVALPIFAESERLFGYRSIEASIRFDLPGEGAATAATLLQGEGQWTLTRQ